MSEPTLHPASFRDPSGFIFEKDGKFFRQVNKSYAAEYDLLHASGLYAALVKKEWLVAHTENSQIIAENESWYKTLEPEQIPFISYPYEWCYGQFRDAALLTLSVLRASLDHGMIIKDATPYNVQFVRGKAIFIDTLSFEKYDASKPWVAYRQFCNLFLFPLYLEYYLKTDFQKTLIAWPDGIPVDVTSRLLPLKSGLSLGVWLHVYLQNTVTKNVQGKTQEERFNKKKLLQLVTHLEGTILRLSTRMGRSVWSNYYSDTILSPEYLAEKEKIFRNIISGLLARTALDLGCNDGYFSKIMADQGISVVAVDNDSRSISNLYDDISSEKRTNLLPLVLDAANPSPAIGFRNRERAAFHDRIRTDLVVALALVHHLVIGKNISLPVLADYFAGIAPVLIIEWIPKNDDKVQQMLASRKDVFAGYSQAEFETQFSRHFNIVSRYPVAGTVRTIYLMEKG